MIIDFKRTIALYSGFLLALAMTMSDPASAIFVDGKGHYSIRGESRQNPAFNSRSAFQAIDQFFRLEAEIRNGDKASFVTEFQLFDNPRQSFLGDTSEPADCSDVVEIQVTDPTTGQTSTELAYPSNTGNSSNCAGQHQNSIEPGYKDYTPRIKKAYAQYASDTCLFTVGRRDRDWGIGVFLDSGKNRFDTAASVYDGVTCDINIQKSQTMGFSVGYDKIVETGTSIDLTSEGISYGPKNQGDDLDQIFFTIEYDDTKTGASNFAQKVGIYFANIIGSDPLKTDIKLADLYLSFFMPNLVLKQEILFRLGKSADPNFTRLGGQASKEGDIVRNKVQSIALAGRMDYYLSKTGSLVGPESLKKGNLTSHSLFFEYSYTPGDKDGYLSQFDSAENPLRDRNASAVSFHRNYKPALILFNSRIESDDLRVDGVFDPGRVTNATIFALGYEFNSMENGIFNLKLLNARLNETMPEQAKLIYEASLASDPTGSLYAPIGYKGSDLGWELDLSYESTFDDGFDLGGALAIALPGSAWNINPASKPKTQFLVQGFAAFHF